MICVHDVDDAQRDFARALVVSPSHQVLCKILLAKISGISRGPTPELCSHRQYSSTRGVHERIAPPLKVSRLRANHGTVINCCRIYYSLAVVEGGNPLLHPPCMLTDAQACAELA